MTFPPRPLPSDYKELCPDFILAEAEECARYYEVPELPQVVFLVMLLNDTVKLNILHRWMIRGVIGVGSWRPANRKHSVTRKRRGARAFPPFWDTEVMADHIRETFKWHLWRSLCPPHPLPEDYRDLCPSFTLPYAKEVAYNFNIPEIVQATFYLMLLNNAVGLSLVSRDTTGGFEGDPQGPAQACPPRGVALSTDSSRRRPWAHGRPRGDGRKNDIGRERERVRTPIMFPNFLRTKQAAVYATENFLWPLRESSTLRLSLLPENHHGLCPNFDLLVAIRYSHNSCIPEMMQVIFYAMVLNDAAELGLSSRIMIDCMMSVLWELNWAIIHQFLLRGRNKEFREGRAKEKRPCSGRAGLGGYGQWNGLSRDPCALRRLNGPGTYFLNPKVMAFLKRPALEDKYLTPAGYRFVLLKADANVNKPLANCIAIYQATFAYDPKIPTPSSDSGYFEQDATADQVAAEAERVHKEEQHKCVEMQAKKAPSLVHHGKKPMVGSLNLPHMGSRKRPRVQDGQDA
ncbi:hypothetical protein Cgig2_023149 [Carnegiea gigantea]|uniref:Uncharacterized protein n=1 Tax=Carnegiea gigantea TaxID=171969 RepID=A0A9Q1QIK2_9CARY|nr:hypothetical protein Cgig2_023149 [Carnegiea gigantea]